jgi:hypothetical protein
MGSDFRTISGVYKCTVAPHIDKLHPTIITILTNLQWFLHPVSLYRQCRTSCWCILEYHFVTHLILIVQQLVHRHHAGTLTTRVDTAPVQTALAALKPQSAKNSKNFLIIHKTSLMI